MRNIYHLVPNLSTSILQAFQDLHAKRIDTAKKINQNQTQISQLQRTVKMAALTEEEINGCSEGTRMYKSVGRM